MDKQRKLLYNRRISIFIIVAITIIFFVGITIYYLDINDAFKKSPKVDVVPNNTYTETLNVVTDMNYEPFSYVLEDGSYSGLDVELIAEVANRLNMNLNLKLMNWTDAQAELLNGNADLILNMEVSVVEESADLIGTIPTAEKQYVVYGYDSVDYLGQLYGKRIGSMQMFKDLGLDITFIDDYSEMFSKLASKELDYVICPIQVANSFLKKIDSKGIIASYPISYMYGCIALKASDTELRDKVNAVVTDLQAEGFIEKLDSKWIVTRYENISIGSFLANTPLAIIGIFVTFLIIAALAIYIIWIDRKSKIQKMHNEEVEIQNRQLAIASQAKSTFLFNMSHDIRTPMNAIIGFTNLAQKNMDDKEKLDNYLAKIEISSNHLLGLINDALEMSKIESNKLELELNPMDINEEIITLDTIMHDLAAKKNQEIKFEINNLNHPYIIGDKLRLNRIFLNLLSNAIKFTGNGGHITFTATEKASDDTYVSFEFMVIDDGMGMSDEFIEKVFVPFERERNSTVSGIQGTGLGMSITKRLVDLMGGTITVKSKINEGTTFIINLEFEITEEYKKEPKVIEEAKEEAKSNKKILVVDDNEINREIINALLDDLGYEIIEATDGVEAVEIVKNSPKDEIGLVLMDIQMPKMNGYEATKEIRSLDNDNSNIPIVALTANAFKEDKDNAINSGMNDHLSKPIEVDKLIEVLNRFVK